MLGMGRAWRYQDWAPHTPGFHEKTWHREKGTLSAMHLSRFFGL